MLTAPKPEPQLTLIQRSDGRFEVSENGYVLKVAGTYEQCKAWLDAYSKSRAKALPSTKIQNLYRAVLRTK